MVIIFSQNSNPRTKHLFGFTSLEFFMYILLFPAQSNKIHYRERLHLPSDFQLGKTIYWYLNEVDYNVFHVLTNEIFKCLLFILVQVQVLLHPIHTLHVLL